MLNVYYGVDLHNHFCDFLGIDSKKVITFRELIPKKLYICNIKICGYD